MRKVEQVHVMEKGSLRTGTETREMSLRKEI